MDDKYQIIITNIQTNYPNSSLSNNSNNSTVTRPSLKLSKTVWNTEWVVGQWSKSSSKKSFCSSKKSNWNTMSNSNSNNDKNMTKITSLIPMLPKLRALNRWLQHNNNSSWIMVKNLKAVLNLHTKILVLVPHLSRKILET